jgi:hypothetical protein
VTESALCLPAELTENEQRILALELKGLEGLARALSRATSAQPFISGWDVAL